MNIATVINYIKNENFNKKIYFIFIGLSIVLYFIFIRLLQNKIYAFYRLQEKITSDMFKSFGSLFAQPEPLESLLYLIGFIVIPFLAFGFYFLYIRYKKYLLCVASAIGICAFFFFIKLIADRLSLLNLDKYLIYFKNTSFIHLLWLSFTKRVFLLRILAISTVIFFTLTFYFWDSFKIDLLINKLFKYNNAAILKRLEPFLLLFIGALIFHPNFIFDIHHYNYFLGPINDIFNGKYLLYGTTHLYGLLNIYFLTVIFKYLLPLSYQSLSFLVFIFNFIFYIGVYYFIKKWLNSYLFAFIGVLSLVSITFFFQTSPTRSAYFFPAMTPFRYGLYLPVLYLLYYFFLKKKKYLKESAILISVLALFWNFDTGLYLSTATFLTLAIFELSGISLWKEKMKNILFLTIKYILYGLSIFTVINIYNYIIIGAWPDWLLFFKEIKPFLSIGAGMYPLPIFGFFEFFIFIYLSVLLLIIYKYVKEKKLNAILLFINLYGIFSLNYYIGESSWQILYVTSAPLILILLFIFYQFSNSIGDQKLKKIIYCCFLSFLFFVFSFLAFKIPVEFNNRNYFNIAADFSDKTPKDIKLYQDILFIKKNFPNISQIPLIHTKDTELLFYSQKTNYFNLYYIFNIYFKKQMLTLINKTLEERPEFLFIGKNEYQNDQVAFFKSGITDPYQQFQILKTLDIYKLKEDIFYEKN